MTRQVTFRPSGRKCAIEANETILEACLRAGLAPDYGCSNGNCGTCKAKLRFGEIGQVRHHDYAFTGPEKMEGCFLMCANRAITDIEVEADVTRSPDDIAVQDIETKVKAIDVLDPQVVRLHLRTPRIRRLRFISGQSVTLAVGDDVQTSLAIASCPCDDRNLYFHVPDVPGDTFSELVFEGNLALRDTVRVSGPKTGAFYLDEQDLRHSLMLCWHTGFAPIVSLTEHAMSLEIEKEIHLYRFSPTPDRQYLPNLCRSWADAYDNIFAKLMPQRVTLLSTVHECEDMFSGIAEQFPKVSDFNVYVAGPPNLVEAARNVFGDLGLSAGQIRTHTDWLGIIE